MMGVYSANARVENIALTVINDVDGSDCGMTYAQRCAAASDGIVRYRIACRVFGERYYGAELQRHEIFEAATIVQSHYRAHMQASKRGTS